MDTAADKSAVNNERKAYGHTIKPAKKTILIVDDSAVNRQLLYRILCTEYDTLEAKNGQEALAVLNRHGDKISLILLDIYMPVMDGYEFMSHWRQDPLLSVIPVVVATLMGDENDEIDALAAGASDYITKPFKPEIIMHRVANIINLRETSAIMNLLEYDQLTGVYSKEFFYRRAKVILENSPDTEYDILCSDIENFKLVNDTYGVSVGDELLRGVAKMCKEYTKDRGICGRLGGDVFACLIKRGADFSDESIEACIQRLNSLTAVKNLVMDFGVYQITDTDMPVSAMCDRAILAIESIKGKFHHYLAYYNDEIRMQLLFEQMITESMETALEQNQFEVYLQPEFNIKSNAISGAEALVRWNHPEKGFLYPGEFIPLFEKNGFITKLDQYMWEKACRILRDWIDAGINPIPLSVNVSRADIYNLTLPEAILDLVQKYGLEPGMLHLELTESSYTENPKQIIEATTKLRNLGFVIEMDDFGSGYSSLNMLSELPVDILKLDMKLIQSEGNESVRRSVLSFIISLAKWMNLPVIAEGVETEEQVNRLKNMNCNYAQGYYYARPMPEADFRRLLSETPVDKEIISCFLPLPAHESRIYANDDNSKVMLIVEGIEMNRCILHETFAANYSIVETRNGETALKYLRDNFASVEIIILDLVMPVMRGFELLSILKQDESLCDIPVIIISQADESSELKAFDMGADGFVAKPFCPEVISRHVQNLVDLAAYRRQQKGLALQKELLSEVYRDPLTGALNRRGFEKASSEISYPLPNTMHALIILVLGKLNKYGDVSDQACNDSLLQKLGVVFEQSLRSDDIVAHNGSDEFIIIIKNTPSPKAALSSGKRICLAAQDCAKDIGADLVSCSAGMAILTHESSVPEAIDLANKALYTAKNSPKGSCCVLFHEEFAYS